MSTPKRARVYANLRTAHLERFAVMVRAVVFFANQRYDFDLAAAPDGLDLRRMGRWRTLSALAGERFDVVELNEPMIMARWFDILAQMAVLRVRGLVTRRRTRIVAYCIHNADPAVEVRRRWRLPLPIARVVARSWVAALTAGFDRLAFGTTGSAELYRSYAGRANVERRARIIEGVPSPCGCLGTTTTADDDRFDLIFLGAFEEHKGIRTVMAAWDQVRAERQELRLNVIGKGRLADEVEAWVATRPEVRLDVDPPRALIHFRLASATALVLPSRRHGTWREQIGLPIVEGLAHGCEIITSSETGLAEWLERAGHHVLGADPDEAELAAAVLEVAAHARPAAEVLAALPDQDQRIAADFWMMCAG